MCTRSHRVDCSRLCGLFLFEIHRAALDDVLRKAFARKCCVTEEHHYVVLLASGQGRLQRLDDGRNGSCHRRTNEPVKKKGQQSAKLIKKVGGR
jgi:hypothetical protein